MIKVGPDRVVKLSKRFYRADIVFAAALGLSEVKVRKARKKFEQLGLITTTPGTRTTGGNLATTYHAVKWSHPDEYVRESRDALVERYTKLHRVPGLPYAKIHRHTFNVLLARVREGKLNHRDLVVWIIIFHWYESKRTSRERVYVQTDGSFRISKRQLVKDTGEPKAIESVKCLYDAFNFSGGAHLFEYEEKYHEFVFKSFDWCTDPSKCETAYKRAMWFKEDIARRTQALKGGAAKKKAERRPEPVGP